MSRLAVDKIVGANTESIVDLSSISNLKMPSGAIIQVVNVNGNSGGTSNTTSGSFTETDTGFRTTITPKFSNSKIMIFCTLGLRLQEASGADAQASYRLYDVTGDAAVSGTESAIRYYDYGNSGLYGSHSHAFNVLLDSWGTTAKTFTFQIKLNAGDGVATGDESDSTSITIMEIAQ